MKVVVSLFRAMIGAGFLLYSFGLAFALGMALSGLGDQASAAAFGGLGIHLAVALLTGLLLLCGMAAIQLSAHDRMGDLAEALREQNELLRQQTRD